MNKRLVKKIAKQAVVKYKNDEPLRPKRFQKALVKYLLRNGRRVNDQIITDFWDKFNSNFEKRA